MWLLPVFEMIRKPQSSCVRWCYRNSFAQSMPGKPMLAFGLYLNPTYRSKRKSIYLNVCTYDKIWGWRVFPLCSVHHLWLVQSSSCLYSVLRLDPTQNNGTKWNLSPRFSMAIIIVINFRFGKPQLLWLNTLTLCHAYRYCYQAVSSTHGNESVPLIACTRFRCPMNSSNTEQNNKGHF